MLRANYAELRPAVARLATDTGATRSGLWRDLIRAAYRHGASFGDYLALRFDQKSDSQRASYLTARRIHRFQRRSNQRDHAPLLRDKTKFAAHFGTLLGRKVLALESVPRAVAIDWMEAAGRFIAKPVGGGKGVGVTRWEIRSRADAERIYEGLARGPAQLLEELVVQHPDLAALQPSSVNTVRVMTRFENGHVHVLGAFLRIGRGAVADNFSAGGVAALVALETGKVGVGLCGWYQTTRHASHPDTGAAIEGFVVPRWKDVIALAEEAARRVPEIKTVGWDIAVKADGACLIEGNDNFDCIVWQMLEGRGMVDRVAGGRQEERNPGLRGS